MNERDRERKINGCCCSSQSIQNLGDVGRCWIEGRGVTVKGRCGEMLDRGAGGYCQREMWGDVGWSKTRGGGYCQREMWGDVG